MLPYSKENSVDCYSIGQNDEILLYGYNQYCKKQVDRLIENGYTVVGIIDKNADGKEIYRGIKVVSSVEQFSITGKICVFIMLQNGMLHWEIAWKFYQQGINRVVFLPMKTGFYYDDIQNEFILQYNYMTEGAYSVMRVPYLRDGIFETEIEKGWRIARRLADGEYIIWIAKELLRTTMQEVEPYRDIPIVNFMPYVNLFFTLAGEERDISEYIRLYGLTPFLETSREAYDYVVKKRRDLYIFYEDKFCSGNMDFFIVSSPKAVWNANGYLNLCEGQHRCVYLLIKGMDYLPVRVDEMVIDYLNQGRMDI